MKLMDYSDVVNKIAETNGKRKWNLLMGNGFSISYNHKIFSYNALHDFVREQDDEVLSVIFEIIKTTNFELVMRQLDATKMLAESFDADSDFIHKLEEAHNKLRSSLIEAIQHLHPEHVFTINEEKSQACSRFLSEFINTKGEIFTTNYDLLMYWILMRNQLPGISDGFGREIEFDDNYDHDDTYEGELIWGNNKDKQNIHYVHGTLPFFDTGISVVKEEYDGTYLMDKIESRIKSDDYPIFVTSGSGKDKLEQIKHNSYLSYCYDRLTRLTGSLVTYGFNFGEYDEHIIAAINKASKYHNEGKLYSIYIGVYSDEDREYIESIESKFDCKVRIFDSKTTNVWGI